VIKKNYTIFYSGHKSDKHEFGTGFYISRDIIENLLNFEPVSERICKIRVIHKYHNLTLISKHTPTEERMTYTKKNVIILWRRYVPQFPIATCKQYYVTSAVNLVKSLIYFQHVEGTAFITKQMMMKNGW
jgi:hypothetical protein